MLAFTKTKPYFCIPKRRTAVCWNRENDLVAQLVEQYTFNVWVLGSNPSRITKKGQSRTIDGF